MPTLKQRLDLIASFAIELRKLGPANFMYADGDVLFAHADRRLQVDTGLVAPPAADSTPFGHSAHADPDTCSTLIRTGSRSAATQGWHC
nr:class II glutamine amidotransferase [uncultured Pseudomonas sp.]